MPYELVLFLDRLAKERRMTVAPGPRKPPRRRQRPGDEGCRPRWMPVFSGMPRYDGCLVFQRERFDAARTAPGAATHGRGASTGRARGHFSRVPDGDRMVERIFRFFGVRSIRCLFEAAFCCVGAGGHRT
jgi:hypothetical protein